MGTIAPLANRPQILEQPLQSFPSHFPPELLRLVARTSGPASGFLRRMNKSTTTLITRSDVAWAEAGAVAFNHGVEQCWNWAVERCSDRYEKEHVPILEAFLWDIDATMHEETLVRAVEANSVEVAKFVLGGQTSNTKDQAFILAVRKRRIAIVKLLLRANPNRPALNKALVSVSTMGCSKMLVSMLEMYDYPQSIKDKSLIRAAKTSKTSVKALLRAGANPCALSDESLRVAARHNRVAITELLLGAGARVIDHPEYNALAIAAMQGHHNIFKTLLKSNPSQNACNHALISAIWSTDRTDPTNRIGVVETLFTVADVHFNNDQALMAAVQNNRLDCVKVLFAADEKGYKASLGLNGRAMGGNHHGCVIVAAMTTARKHKRKKLVRFFLEFFEKNGISYRDVQEYREFYEGSNAVKVMQ
ncbi:hypothetical protein HDV00_012371 [Rhizophlyctis rosea]|nr:hypothetical protein HDV00_012371 [Rhizophlyctis rosea]